jgi:hypothetical protein
VCSCRADLYPGDADADSRRAVATLVSAGLVFHMARGGVRRGAGRPKGELRVSVTVTLLPKTLHRIDREAFNSVKSRGEVIDAIIVESQNKSRGAIGAEDT